VPTYDVVSPDGVDHDLYGVPASTARYVVHDGVQVDAPYGSPLVARHGDQIVSPDDLDHPLLVPAREPRRRRTTASPEAPPAPAPDLTITDPAPVTREES